MIAIESALFVLTKTHPSVDTRRVASGDRRPASDACIGGCEMSIIRTSPASRARNRARSAAWLTVLALVLVALFLPASTVAVDTPGNNGTVKVHDGPNEPAAEVRNEPHVCTFHLHFFFADPTQ